MGPTALIPLLFFALKNPTASAVFEPANLGTKGQHANSRPLKPLLVRSLLHCPVVSNCNNAVGCLTAGLGGGGSNYVLQFCAIMDKISIMRQGDAINLE
jgi:hypothetical protein